MFLHQFTCHCPCISVICLAIHGLWFGAEIAKGGCGWGDAEATEDFLIANCVVGQCLGVDVMTPTPTFVFGATTIDVLCQEVFVVAEDLTLFIVGAPVVFNFTPIYAAYRGGCSVESLIDGKMQRWKQCGGFFCRKGLL